MKNLNLLTNENNSSKIKFNNINLNKLKIIKNF